MAMPGTDAGNFLPSVAGEGLDTAAPLEGAVLSLFRVVEVLVGSAERAEEALSAAIQSLREDGLAVDLGELGRRVFGRFIAGSSETVILSVEHEKGDELQEDFHCFNRALHLMPLEYKIAFLLKDALGLPIELIAQMVALPVVDTRTILRRARLMLLRHTVTVPESEFQTFAVPRRVELSPEFRASSIV